MTGLPSFYYTMAAASGIVAHAAYFNRGEHYLNGAFYVALTLLTCSTGTGFLMRLGERSIASAVLSVIGLAASFFTGLYTSLLTYRVLLHPLRKFPGPFWARVSNFWWSSQISNGDAYQQIDRLHEEFGDFIRIGASDLSIVHPEAPQAIYGANSKCRKSFMYDINKPMESMHSTRNRKVHDQRRRLWSGAFGDKALSGYETRIRGYGDRLKARMEKGAGTPTNVAQWFKYYAFDVVGDLTLGESFGMLDKGDTHWAIKTISENMDILTMQCESESIEAAPCHTKTARASR